jgi:serine protease Do
MTGRMVALRRAALAATIGVSAWAVGAQDVATGPTRFGVRPAAAAPNRPAEFTEVVDRVKPSVVGVRVKRDRGKDDETGGGPSPDDPVGTLRNPDTSAAEPGRPQRPGAAAPQGSAFFISAEGHAVTTYHVIEGSTTVELTTDDGKVYPATVIGTDAKTDLALLKADATHALPWVQLAEKAPRIGEWILTVGNPFGLGGTVTAGIVSGRARNVGAGMQTDFLQIDAPVNVGSAGGPTFDLDGHVVGVTSAILAPGGGSVGIGFAVPAETVRAVVSQLKEKGEIRRGWIGVRVQAVTTDIAETLGLKQVRGALVSEPEPSSPAAKAGIVSGDVIVSLNGEALADDRDLARKVGALAPGAAVALGVIRKGEEKVVSLTLGELPGSRG